MTNKEYIFGAHNSLSCYRPKHWYMRPFWFMAKCQQHVPRELFYRHGVRVFDFRVVFDKNGKPSAAHGIMDFDVDIEQALEQLNRTAYLNDANVFVRIILERPKHSEFFADWCEKIVKENPHLIFFGGEDKKSWKKLYVFGNELDRPLVDKYSSCNYDKPNNSSGTRLDDLTPFIYAKLYNEKWREYYKNEKIYLFQDFIGKY